MLVDVHMITPERALFKGKAGRVMLPGEEGVFEILPFHKHIISRLISGTLKIDEEVYEIKRGIARAYNNRVTLIVEQ